jgi:serine/threonine protein kinase
MALETRLGELLQRWQDMRRVGKVVSAEDLCHDCPELAGELGRLIQDMLGAGEADLEPHATAPVPPILLANLNSPLTPLDISGNTDENKLMAESIKRPLALLPDSEPVPGYRLVDLLGRGGFGEAWKALGPGGFPVALKFLRIGEGIAVPEVRSLSFLKDIRHANLLSVFGAWQNEDFIIIAMELADRTLLDRSRQLTSRGQIGIPFAELIDYMYDAAKGVDYLNEMRHVVDGKVGVSIQHRDIKPHNLFLVGDSVKVGDFGLARALEQNWTQHSGSMTPAYAAPEFFQGQTSDRSDQYSLAVTYCHLRGGRLPFSGNIAQITAGHLLHPPNLTMLPLAERPVVLRALAKKPQERWPTCRAFIRALAAAQGEPTPTGVHIPAVPPGAPLSQRKPKALEDASAERRAFEAPAAPTAKPSKPAVQKISSSKWSRSQLAATPPTADDQLPAAAPPKAPRGSGLVPIIKPEENPEAADHPSGPVVQIQPAATEEPAQADADLAQAKSIRLVRPSPSDRMKDLQERQDRLRGKVRLVLILGGVLLMALLGTWVWSAVWSLWLQGR